jgi:hypothetical protein
MSNPWSQAYEELRKPYLEGKMAKKDYDGDGKIETGTQEYMGSRDKAIKKAMGKKIAKEHHQKDKDGNTIPHEDTTPSSVEEENINELSNKTLGGYIKKASKETRGNMVATQHGSGISKKGKDIKLKQVNKRLKGMEKAGAKMAKEEIVLTKGDYASRNVPTSAYAIAQSKNFDENIYKAGAGLDSNFLPIDEKMHEVKSMRYGDGEKEQAARLKKLAKKRGMPMSKMKDHPQFKKEEKEPPRMQKGAMAYDGPNKARSLAADRVLAKTKAKREKMVKKESFSDWRSEFVWEDGDSVKKT